MTKSRESKMLGYVRRWREKSYEADRAKPSSKRTKEDEELARKLKLPLIQMHKAGSTHQR